MVPISSNNSSDSIPSPAGTESTVGGSTSAPTAETVKPPAKVLIPQERKNKKLQQRLETSIAESLPPGSNSPSNGFITSLAPSGKALTVTLDQGWYQLEPLQQEAIATALWSQRDNLKFQKLKLQDPQGKILARPPVVGDQMIILRR